MTKDTSSPAGPGRTTPRRHLHPLAVVTILMLMFPLNFKIGALFMTPSRMLFLFTVPYLLIRWAKGDFRRTVSDWLVLFYVFWMMIVVIHYYPTQAVTFVGTTSVIVLGGYMTARATIRDVADFQALARFLAMLVMICAPLALYESLNGRAFILDFLGSLPGFSSYKDVNYCCRLGLDRAQVVFVHPIHYGIFASLPFALYVFGLRNQLSLFRRCAGAFVIGVATFLSISSGAFLAMMFQAMLSGYGMVTDKIRTNWKTLLITLGLGYAVIEVNTDHVGIFAVASKLSFNSGTAYVRSILFEYGIQQIWRTPILGNGYRPFPLPPFLTGSLDNFWLLLAIVYGLPGFFALFGAFVYSMIKAGGTFERGSDLYNARVAWTVLLVSLTLSLATVAIWSEVHSLVMLMLGAGQFLFFAKEPATAAAPAAETEIRPRRRYTRGLRPQGESGGPLPALARTQLPYTRFPGPASPRTTP